MMSSRLGLYERLLLAYVLMLPAVMTCAAVNMMSLSIFHRIYAFLLLAMSVLTYVIVVIAAKARKLPQAIYFLTFAQSALILTTVLLSL